MGIPPIVGDDPVTMVDSAKQCSVKQVVEPESSNSTPSVSWKWNEEDINAPTSEFGNMPIAYIYIYFEFMFIHHVCSHLEIVPRENVQTILF